MIRAVHVLPMFLSEGDLFLLIEGGVCIASNRACTCVPENKTQKPSCWPRACIFILPEL